MSYLLKYNSYTFPATFYPADMAIVNRVPVEGLPRADGGRALAGYLDSRRVLIRGGLLRDNAATLRSKLDSLRGALYGSRPGTLYFGDSDRYLRLCEAEDIRLPFEPTWFSRICNGIEIPFVTPDPYFYAVAASSDTWTVTGSAQTRSVTTAGNAPCAPAFSITVGGVGAQTIAFTITNQTTGESFTLAGAVTGGDVIVVDTLAQTVVIGTTDKIALFDGLWPRLAVGANTLLESYTGGSITQVVTTWNNRWF